MRAVLKGPYPAGPKQLRILPANRENEPGCSQIRPPADIMLYEGTQGINTCPSAPSTRPIPALSLYHVHALIEKPWVRQSARTCGSMLFSGYAKYLHKVGNCFEADSGTLRGALNL